VLDDGIIELPELSSGDRVGELSGVVGYGYGAWRLSLVDTPEHHKSAPDLETSNLFSDATGITIASYNVHNLHPGAGSERFARVAGHLVEKLRSPAIVALQEIQDNNGPKPSGVAADKTYETLLSLMPDALHYEVAQIDPEEGADGGQPNGNIRCALLWRSDMVSLQRRGRQGSRSAVKVQSVGGITPSPGLIAPADRAFAGSRKPLAAWFRVRGRDVVVIVVHLSSKYGDSPFLGRAQPPIVDSLRSRRRQAELIAGFVESLSLNWPEAEVVVIGDCNDLPDSEALSPWLAAGLVHATGSVPLNDRYSYVYQGLRQLIDQAWVTPGLAAARADAVHLNVPLPESRRASDHDPIVVKLLLPE
jgi:predicted extracellular nuclease